MRRSGRKSRFTLVELLVVVAIMLLLMALLLPALSKAKDRAAAMSCINNLKQMGSAVYSYAGDYNEYTPFASYRRTGSYTYGYWASLLSPYVGDKYPGRETMRCMKYSGSVYGCYAMNLSASADSGWQRKLAEFTHPSTTLLFFDATGCSELSMMEADPSSADNNCDQRHFNMANWSFVDAHAEASSYLAVTYGHSPLWWTK